jgi:hypothetical protein
MVVPVSRPEVIFCWLRISLTYMLLGYVTGWIVKDLTLYHTTAVYGNTGERATMSNGSLASSRVCCTVLTSRYRFHCLPADLTPIFSLP